MVIRAAVIENGIVVNMVAAEDHEISSSIIVADIDTDIGDNWDGIKFTKKPPAPIPVPISVSPRQIRQALTRANLRASVESAIAAGDQDTKDWYEYATEFQRTNPHVINMGIALNVSESQLDDLWRLAGSL